MTSPHSAPAIFGDDLERFLPLVGEMDGPVLIFGEPGAGHERAARVIHANSPRKREAFTVLRCAKVDAGAIERALLAPGTLYLDEISELRPDMQEVLLRLLFNSPVPSACRVISATTVNLDRKVALYELGEEFYYRVSGLTVRIPPIRFRKNEIVPLARAMLTQMAMQLDRVCPEIDAEFETFLLTQPWPKNLSEFEAAIVAYFYTAGNSSQAIATIRAAAAPEDEPAKDFPTYRVVKDRSIEGLNRWYLPALLDIAKGNQAAAARVGRMSYKSFRDKCTALGLISQPTPTPTLTGAES